MRISSIALPALAFAIVGTSGCADIAQDPEPSVAAPTRTVEQPVLEPNGPNWYVAGGNGFGELSGGVDGEPARVTGRFALEGAQITSASAGADRLIVAGAGKVQPVDDDGVRLRETRDALGGETAQFIEPAPIGWIVGGSGGQIQLLDAQGEPTLALTTVLGGGVATSAAHNGVQNWLVGGANGNVVLVPEDLSAAASPDGQNAFPTPIDAVVSDAVAPSDWIAFSGDSYSRISSVGTPQAAVQIEANLAVTYATFDGGSVFMGTSDGRVGRFDYGTMNLVGWTTVFTNSAVQKLAPDGAGGFLVMGDNGWAATIDAAGAVVASETQIDGSSPLTGARFANQRWLIAVGDIAVVRIVNADLTPLRDLDELLGGEQLNAASTGDNVIAVVGNAGAYQIVDDFGANVSSPQTAGATDLHAVSYNGENFLIAGDGGFAQVIDPQGNPVGASQTLLDGNPIRFAAWSGEFWLIGGDGGLYQRVRSDGTQSEATKNDLSEIGDLRAARWSGREWLVAGTSADQMAAGYAIIYTDGTAKDAGQRVGGMDGGINAVDFNGLEFLLAGNNGLVQRVNAEGSVVNSPIDVFMGIDIHALHFNGLNYMLGGDNGAIVRLGQDYLPLRPVSLLDGATVRAIAWSTARGFPSGPCLTNTVCYAGPCVGGLQAGRCCESACDRACESCFQDDTGETDGLCRPIVADKQPAIQGACPRVSETECGTNGLCDGAGECAFFGADVEVEPGRCGVASFTPAVMCTGDGARDEQAEVDCSPYVDCSVTEGCATSCTEDGDCVTGFECVDAACAEIIEDMEPEPGPGDGDDEKKGCCATIDAPAGANNSLLMLLAALSLIGLRRRR